MSFKSRPYKQVFLKYKCDFLKICMETTAPLISKLMISFTQTSFIHLMQIQGRRTSLAAGNYMGAWQCMLIIRLHWQVNVHRGFQIHHHLT